MSDGWLALYISIVKTLAPEQAFLLLENPVSTPMALGSVFDEKDVDDMLKLKEEMTLKELAECYGTSVTTIASRMSKGKKKKLRIAKNLYRE